MNKKSIEIYDQFFLNTGFTSFDLNFLNLFQATEKTKKNKKSKKIKKLKNLSISFSDEENYSNILKDKKNNEIKEEEQVLTGEINESSTIENNDQTISEKKFDIKKSIIISEDEVPIKKYRSISSKEYKSYFRHTKFNINDKILPRIPIYWGEYHKCEIEMKDKMDFIEKNYPDEYENYKIIYNFIKENIELNKTKEMVINNMLTLYYQFMNLNLKF